MLKSWIEKGKRVREEQAFDLDYSPSSPVYNPTFEDNEPNPWPATEDDAPFPQPSFFWAENNAELQDVKEAIAKVRESVCELFMNEEQVAQRVVAFRMLARAGIPLRCLQDGSLRMKQKDGSRLDSVVAVKPFVVRLLQDEIAGSVKENMVSIIVDGAKTDTLVGVCVVRYVSLSGKITHLCSSALRLPLGLDAEQWRCLIAFNLESCRISRPQIVCAVSDAAPVNRDAIRSFNWEVGGFDDETRLANSMPSIACFPSAIARVYQKWIDSMQSASRLLKSLQGMRANLSAEAIFFELTGVKLGSLPEDKWMRWLELVDPLLRNWNKVPSFFKQCIAEGILPKKASKVLAMTDGQMLSAGLELLLMQRFGTLLSSTCKFLEGEGFLAPYTFSKLESLNLCLSKFPGSDEDELLLKSLQDFAYASPVEFDVADSMAVQAWRMKSSLESFWREEIWWGMSANLSLFQGFSVLDPVQVCRMGDGEVLNRLELLVPKEKIESCGDSKIRRVAGLKFFTNDTMKSLCSELGKYLELAHSRSDLLKDLRIDDQPARLWQLWIQEHQVQAWARLACVAALHQPSSAVIERFLSLYKGEFSSEETDSRLLCCQLRFNNMP